MASSSPRRASARSTDRLLEQTHIPIVLLNNQHPSQFAHSVMIENFEASRRAVHYLTELGHQPHRVYR